MISKCQECQLPRLSEFSLSIVEDASYLEGRECVNCGSISTPLWRRDGRPLLVQRLRSLPQDEQRHQSPPVEASSSTGEFHFNTNSTRFLHLHAMRAIALMINSYKVFYLCQVPCGIMLKFILKFATMGNSFFFVSIMNNSRRFLQETL